jgi:hypothetical protein
MIHPVPPSRNPYYSNIWYFVAFSLSAESGTTYTLTLTFTDPYRNQVAGPNQFDFYFSSSADGLTPSTPGTVADGGTGSLVTTTGGLYKGLGTGGVCQVAVTNTGSTTLYPVVCQPDGSIAVGPAMNF